MPLQYFIFCLPTVMFKIIIDFVKHCVNCFIGIVSFNSH